MSDASSAASPSLPLSHPPSSSPGGGGSPRGTPRRQKKTVMPHRPSAAMRPNKSTSIITNNSNPVRDENSKRGADAYPPVSPQQPRPPLDRMIFSSIQFSAPTFVNNIANRILFPILPHGKDAVSTPVSRTGVADSGTALWHQRTDSSANIMNAMRSNSGISTPRTGEAAAVVSGGDTGSDSLAVANYLTTTLESALAEIEKIQEEEEQSLRGNEIRCRRVEIREKRRLATIRLGLEATTARLHEYENRVCNALAATAGIEQHLSQSNARVMRGRSVSQLLKHFKMFTSMNHGELSTLLKNLSKARAEQRAVVTSQWEAGHVSPSNPMYFGGAWSSSSNAVGGGGDDDSVDDNDDESDDNDSEEDRDSDAVGGEDGDSNNGPGHRKDRFDDKVSRSDGSRLRDPFKQGGPRQLRRRGVRVFHSSSNEASATRRTGRRHADASPVGGGREKMHRVETAAVAAGLDRKFAVRSYTEVQVEWCQRLTYLCRELNNVVGNTSNIDLYVGWVRQELVADVFHLIDRFNELYKERSDAAVHQPYGRAILKTLELISWLYASITDSQDALLSVFYSWTINQMGMTLFSGFSPKPLPPQPPLNSTTTTTSSASASAGTTGAPSAMQHYRSSTEPDLHRTFDFLISRARQDVIIVETIFGTTNSTRQQLLAQMMEGVVKPFVTQQLKLVEFFERDMVEAEARLSPRSKRRASTRVVDAIAYSHTMQARLFSFFQDYVKELCNTFERGEVDFLNKYVDSIFVNRSKFVEQKAELLLLRRYHTLLEEQYTRALHPIPDEVFDLREAHMKKTKELIDRLTEVVARTRIYAPAKDVTSCVFDLVKESLDNMGRYMEEEIRKMIESLRADRENWRVKPKSEEELLRPTKLESQQCGLRMLLFVQSSLMSLNDAIDASCLSLLQMDPHLEAAIEDAKESAYETLDERAEMLLNLCANAIIVRSLSILLHYQNRNDYKPKVAKGAEGEMLAQPCTRACTLFCLYITRQFEEAKEFIRLSNGQVPHRQNASFTGNGVGATIDTSSIKINFPSMTNLRNNAKTTNISNDALNAVRARARTMNMQQLLYGDGGPSSFVRTVGVCLYRGIAVHVKSFTVTDRGALIYKQDVTAYMEAMGPVIRTPGLGGAVVEVLFRLLKETASLLLMPWGHIKGIRDTGLLRLMSNEEQVQFIKMREDVQEGFRKIKQ